MGKRCIHRCFKKKSHHPTRPGPKNGHTFKEAEAREDLKLEQRRICDVSSRDAEYLEGDVRSLTKTRKMCGSVNAVCSPRRGARVKPATVPTFQRTEEPGATIISNSSSHDRRLHQPHIWDHLAQFQYDLVHINPSVSKRRRKFQKPTRQWTNDGTNSRNCLPRWDVRN